MDQINKRIMKLIVNAVDTGAGIQSITKDVVDWSKNNYSEKEVGEQISIMIGMGMLIDRGPYYVFSWSQEHKDYIGW